MVVTTLVAALLPAVTGLAEVVVILLPDVPRTRPLVLTAVSGAAAAVSIPVALRLDDRVRSTVAVSALALALTAAVPGPSSIVLVSVAQACLVAAGLIARTVLGRVLVVLAALWFVVPLASTSIPFTGASPAALLWVSGPALLRAAAYLVAVVLVTGPVWVALRRGVRHLRDTAEVR